VWHDIDSCHLGLPNGLAPRSFYVQPSLFVSIYILLELIRGGRFLQCEEAVKRLCVLSGKLPRRKMGEKKAATPRLPYWIRMMEEVSDWESLTSSSSCRHDSRDATLKAYSEKCVPRAYGNIMQAQENSGGRIVKGRRYAKRLAVHVGVDKSKQANGSMGARKRVQTPVE
jgi:hypothetical protein